MADNAKCVRCAYTLTWVGLWDSLLLALFKGAVGVFTHSRALTISAIYSVHDVISALAILFGMKEAERPADAEHPYGHGQMENVVSLLTGVIIFTATLFLLGEASLAIAFEKYPQPHWTALVGALIAALVEATIYGYNICAYRHINSPAILTHAQHHKADAISSVVVVFAVIGAKTEGWHFLDPLVAILEALHLLHLSGGIIYHAGLGLLDRSPGEAQLGTLRDAASRIAGPEAMKGVQARQVGRGLWVDLHLSLPPELSMDEAQRVSERVRNSLRRTVKHVDNVSIIYE
jgi:cation diffusion facilitator family transporter